MKILNEMYAEVYHDAALNAVVIKWKDFASPADYQKVVETAYELALDEKCQSWISDMTAGKAVSVTSVNWLKNKMIPKIAREGTIRKVAILIDYNPARRIFAETLKDIILMNGISFKSFKIKSDMEDWVKGSNQTKKEHEEIAASFGQYF